MRGIRRVHSVLPCNCSHDAAGQPPHNRNAMATTPLESAADDNARQLSRRTVSSVICPTGSQPKNSR